MDDGTTEQVDLDLDMDEWEISDLEDFMAKTGRTIGNVFEATSTPSLADIRAFFWIAKRRKEPDYTYEQTGRIKLRELNEMLGSIRPNAEAAQQAAMETGSPDSAEPTPGARPKRSGG